MRLLIQEYLQMLKEDSELEDIVHDLSSSMGLTIIAGPQKGVRQDGVDIHAIGVDPDDNVKKNFLITIKKGNIDRNIWDSSKQGVRSSLNEIIDVYVKNRLNDEDKKLPTKIILSCGGELKQEAQTNWTGYQSSYQAFQFDLWNGSKLSSLIEEYLLNENIFLKEIKNKMRRTLVVLSDYNYDLFHYKGMLHDLFSDKKWSELKNPTLEKQALKALSVVPVCLGMINEYSKDANNLKHPLIASEYTLLRCWDFIKKNGLQKNEAAVGKFYQVLNLHFNFGAAYFSRLEPYFKIRDGVTINCRNTILASEVVFEQIGILGTIGISQLLWSIARNEPQGTENAKVILHSLKCLVSNNGISASPSYDEMTIEITIAVLFLAMMQERDFVKKWLEDIIYRFNYSYCVIGRGFPLAYDSIEPLVEFERGKEHSKEEMSSMSTLLPTIAYWCAILELDDTYEQLLEFIEKELPHCCLQFWFPRKGIKDQIFYKYAGNEFGVTEAPIRLPKTLKELKNRLSQFIDFSKKSNEFETDWLSETLPDLPLMASRHFRTPVIPFLWLSISENSQSEMQE